ncbi:reticulon-3-like [Periophthalmus magnuspinnatus]|uniref:reticulon-3-like n=1 Tax=Periophthalmus magnuspinnatus TaxID=409849 RepID=UPI0024371A95|nr:reticulon-3-like [Periophthalmus magnuspinnatus]
MADSSSSSLPDSTESSVQDYVRPALRLLQWEEPKKSAVAFFLTLTVLVSMATLSVISVVSYLLLTCLCCTITFRVYKAVVQALQKSDEGHPFRSLLERDLELTQDSVRQFSDQTRIYLNRILVQTRRLLLVQDLVDSLKFAGAMWILTFIGAVFNGLTLLILADVAAFTGPLLYQRNKTQVDEFVERAQNKLQLLLLRLQDRLPGAVKKLKPE